MPSTISRRGGAVMGQMPDVAHVGAVTRQLVEVAVGISRSLPHGTRLPEIRKLEEQLLDGRSVTLERTLRLVLFAQSAGGAVAPFWRTLATALSGAGAWMPRAVTVNEALVLEMDAKCNEMPLLARVLAGGETAADLRQLRDRLVSDRMSIDLSIESIDAEIAARRMVA